MHKKSPTGTTIMIMEVQKMSRNEKNRNKQQNQNQRNNEQNNREEFGQDLNFNDLTSKTKIKPE